ncbi:MAG: autotransporter domain-containing protein, partial [Hyphomicrobiaceae bacterium]|nr:autotransporter domain-containing protein [Hyphomicrobiaceae bacterium]
ASGNTGALITTSGGVVSGSTYGIGTNVSNGGATINNLAGGTIRTDTIGAGTFAIHSDAAGVTTVNNTGTVTGNVQFLGGGIGNSLFNNQVGGLFNAGTTVNLGAGNRLRNAGTLAPGGEGAIQTTELDGNITQTGTGTFQVDVDQTAGTADRVNASGSAELDGNVQVRLQNAAPGEQSVTILSAAGGTTDNGLDVLSSPILQASLSFPNATDVVLTTEIDFTPDSVDLGVDLNVNQTNIAEHLDESFNAGGGGLGPVFEGLLNGVVSGPDYIAALDQLLPEIYLNTQATALFAAEEFNGNLLSCPKAGEGFTAISQGQCMWLHFDGRWLDRDSTYEHIGFNEDTHGVSGGGQVAIAPNWFVGIAGAYENSNLDTRTNASADSDRYMLGGVIKYHSGPVLMALAGSIGTGEVDVARPIDFGGFTATARSSFDVDHAGATFHAAYLMDRASWYAKPFIDVNAIHVERDAARETGGGAANLNIAGSSETIFSVTPALELGTTFEWSGGRAIRPYMRAGVTFYGDTDQSLTARFANAPGGVGAFQTLSEFDDIFADVEAGVTLFNGAQHTFSAGYEGHFSDNTQVHGVFFKGTRKF